MYLVSTHPARTYTSSKVPQDGHTRSLSCGYLLHNRKVSSCVISNNHGSVVLEIMNPDNEVKDTRHVDSNRVKDEVKPLLQVRTGTGAGAGRAERLILENLGRYAGLACDQGSHVLARACVESQSGKNGGTPLVATYEFLVAGSGNKSWLEDSVDAGDNGRLDSNFHLHARSSGLRGCRHIASSLLCLRMFSRSQILEDI